ncbi:MULTISPECIES: FxDxF family PEP-CTERM protein [unclassified Duganella]|uniref:FxDxF family PEP-CTERM protein n=1 Tax=unclassified Duganella TaxID=2636909 RepID=UPI00088FFE89|nr:MULTISPECIES: FxDxF family PEP-CTERM protein [unclassified Duganella]SDH36489.1 PEP-CTERM protein-sorting domain-containing protein [Duganella sp. OV458]SDK52846.1 PEP-CTERM protein-sorting domain-containing protein [Duganella sp. OV510]
MKKITSILIGLVLAAASAFASAADFERTEHLSLVDGSSGFGSATEFAAGSKGKTFSDLFFFDIPALSNAGSNISAISLDDSTGIDFTLFNLYQVGSTVAAATGGLDADSGLWILSGSNLSSGSYYLKIEGQVSSTDVTIYSGNLLVSAVPEAETYAMLLAGLGLVGLVARRRKSVA